ncbi:ATP-binding protein [Streptomyces sp. RFCAC02]|uniref:ATP-binding protein n=1 Tax=Streptomyces sp. RFCAC02 TaxID=2499143 RepID=UPI0010200F53|nr:ATP-binding protein [Streptomyces sp. RFCAC02]
MDSRPEAPPRPGTTAPSGHAGTWRFTVPPDDLSVPRARHAVRDLLVRRAVPLTPDRLHSVLVILSELVTNAVRHAALLTPEIGVDIALDGRTLRVAVEDGHPYRPHALDVPPDGHGTGGRGLLLVQTIAEEAGGSSGADPTAAGGKTVWAVLPLDGHPPGPLTSPRRSP